MHRGRSVAVALCAAAGLALTGCAAGGGNNASQGSDARYVQGVPGTTIFAAAQRQAAPQVSGSSLTGAPVTLSALRGKPVVLNLWASWCGPCRQEAPELARANARFSPRGVQFVGIDIRDGRASALAFSRNVQMTYPSIFDPTGDLLLAFRGSVPPTAIPSTLVLDAEGRIAARVIGAVSYAGLVKILDRVAGISS